MPPREGIRHDVKLIRDLDRIISRKLKSHNTQHALKNFLELPPKG